MLDDALFQIASALNYNKIDRLRASRGSLDDEWLLSILRTTVDSFAILFFPGSCYQITPFGGVTLSRILSRGDQPYLIAHPVLSEKFLRQAFTGLELVVYKLCHILLRGQSSKYSFESEKLVVRLRKLKSYLSVPNWIDFQSLFDNIFFVRNAFAHSFVPLEDIKYCGVPLGECFGDSYTGRTMRDGEAAGARIFTDDLSELFRPIISLFCEHQLKQIDPIKFEKLCDRVLMARSMSPGL